MKMHLLPKKWRSKELNDQELEFRNILHYYSFFVGSSEKKISVTFNLKLVLKWVFGIAPTMYLKTNNIDCKTINSMDDFSQEEANFMKSTNYRGSSTAVIIGTNLFSIVSIGSMGKNTIPMCNT